MFDEKARNIGAAVGLFPRGLLAAVIAFVGVAPVLVTMAAVVEYASRLPQDRWTLGFLPLLFGTVVLGALVFRRRRRGRVLRPTIAAVLVIWLANVPMCFVPGKQEHYSLCRPATPEQIACANDVGDSSNSWLLCDVRELYEGAPTIGMTGCYVDPPGVSHLVRANIRDTDGWTKPADTRIVWLNETCRVVPSDAGFHDLNPLH